LPADQSALAKRPIQIFISRIPTPNIAVLFRGIQAGWKENSKPKVNDRNLANFGYWVN
jgi:hypothetical protein